MYTGSTILSPPLYCILLITCTEVVIIFIINKGQDTSLTVVTREFEGNLPVHHTVLDMYYWHII